MSKRPAVTNWLCCLMVVAGPAWSPVSSVTVRSPPKNPTTIEAQAKFFQYRHLPTHEDYMQGHRQGSDRHFTERHEQSRPSDGLFSAKVRWGDKQGGYGEHYWDLNHAGHAGNHGSDEYDGNSDDGSYNHDLDHAHEDHDTYDEPSEQHPTYETEDYDPEQAAKYDENGRAKRAHPRIKTERKLVREEEMYEEEPQKQKVHRKLKERLQTAPTQQADKVLKENEEHKEPIRRRRRQRKPQNEEVKADNGEASEVNQKEKQNQPEEITAKEPQYYVNRAEKQFVPYEQGAGVRQHQQPDITPAASVPRLFLEPTTGHVVDRATGQAYVLQPIAVNNYN